MLKAWAMVFLWASGRSPFWCVISFLFLSSISHLISALHGNGAFQLIFIGLLLVIKLHLSSHYLVQFSIEKEIIQNTKLVCQKRRRGHDRSKQDTGPNVIWHSLGQRGLGGKAALGMGLLGTAFAAYEHFSAQNKPATAAPPSSPTLGSNAPPPPPNNGMSSSLPTSPPPPPDASIKIANTGTQDLERNPATWLIRAMIAASNADGVIDQQEMLAIMQRVQDAGLGDDAMTFMQKELAQPRGVNEIISAAQIVDPNEIYAASLLAITIDTPIETAYLQELKQGLQLNDTQVATIHNEMGA